MSVKSKKILLGRLNDRDVYAIGPYAEDIKIIVVSQASKIMTQAAKIRNLEKEVVKLMKHERSFMDRIKGIFH
jgi:hypothetical protein